MSIGSEYKVQVDKLEGPEDWSKWKWHILMILRAYELEDIVNGSKKRPELSENPEEKDRKAYQKWMIDDAKAASLLAGALGKSVAELVLTCTNANEIWKKLCARFERSSAQRLNMLIESFFRVTRDTKEDINTHIAKLQKLFVDLNDELQKNEENTLSERILNGRILSTLGKEYDSFKDIWDTIPSENQTVNLLIEKLCAIELRENNQDQSSAFVTCERTKKQPNKLKKSTCENQKKNAEQAKLKFPCHKCKKLGHWAAECPEKKKHCPDGNKKYSESKAFVAGVMEADKWCCDSGATNHITANKQYFHSYEKFAVPEEISLGKRNVSMQAHGQGTVKIQVYLNNSWSEAELRNVLYVPDAKMNLFSVKSVVKRGFSVKFDESSVNINERSTGKTVMVGNVSHGLYVLDMRVIISKENTVEVNLVSSSETLQVYHERFGHQHKQHVKSVLKQMNIDVDNGTEEFCDGCALGKMHRLPFKHRMNRPSVTGEQIHADVNGPMSIESLGKARYYVCFKDDYSKFRRIFFLRQKSDVCRVLKQFLNEAETNGHVVKQLRCDGGKEFDNRNVSELLAKRGIEHCISTPYTPEQNGVAERENRTIVECARSMLNPTKLPKNLWAEACNTAAYILNHTGKSSVENKSPYELWYGRPVGSLRHLKIFGTECYVHINKQFRSKFDDKAVHGHMVGYVNERDGYRVYLPAQKKVVLSHDVKFKPEVVCNLRHNVGKVDNQTEHINLKISCEPERIQEEDNQKDTEKETEESLPCSSGGSTVGDEISIEDERKSKRQAKKPSWLTGGEYVYMAGSHVESDCPNNYCEVIQSKEKNQWLKAIEEELDSLKENDTWVLVDRPNNVQILKNRWVLRKKTAEDGNTRFKARLVC
jgi:hypothetical protein